MRAALGRCSVEIDEGVEIEEDAGHCGGAVGFEVGGEGCVLFGGGGAGEGEREGGGDGVFFLGEALGEGFAHGFDETVVPLGEGLEGGGGFIALRDALRGVGAVEAGEKGLGLAADDEAVDAAAVGGGVARVVEVVLVMRGVLGFFDDKVLEAGAAARVEPQNAADGEQTIAEFLGGEPAAVGAPEVGVVGIQGGVGFIMRAGAAVGAAGDEQAEDVFERVLRVIPSVAARWSSSSGWVGSMPMRPKSFGLATRPWPKVQSQRRLTMLRQKSGLSREVMALASSARAADSGAAGGRAICSGAPGQSGGSPGRMRSPGARMSPRFSRRISRGLPAVAMKRPCAVKSVAAA